LKQYKFYTFRKLVNKLIKLSFQNLEVLQTFEQ